MKVIPTYVSEAQLRELLNEDHERNVIRCPGGFDVNYVAIAINDEKAWADDSIPAIQTADEERD